MQSILSTSDINDDLVKYIYGKSLALSKGSKETIEAFQDSEFYNPDMPDFLASQSDLDDAAEMPLSPLHLVLGDEKNLAAEALFLRGRFQRLKEKIRRVFCATVKGLGNVDTKEIIKKVLLALIPAFAGGIAAMLLPLVVGIIASLIKYGVSNVC